MFQVTMATCLLAILDVIEEAIKMVKNIHCYILNTSKCFIIFYLIIQVTMDEVSKFFLKIQERYTNIPISQ